MKFELHNDQRFVLSDAREAEIESFLTSLYSDNVILRDFEEIKKSEATDKILKTCFRYILDKRYVNR